MPKIPTFTAEGSIEQLQGSTQTPQIKLNQTLATALAPVTKMVVDQKNKRINCTKSSRSIKIRK